MINILINMSRSILFDQTYRIKTKFKFNQHSNLIKVNLFIIKLKEVWMKREHYQINENFINFLEHFLAQMHFPKISENESRTGKKSSQFFLPFA